MGCLKLNDAYTYNANGDRVRKVRVLPSGRRFERIYLGAVEYYRVVNGNGSLRKETQSLHILDDQNRVALLDTQTVDNGNTINNPTPVQRYQLFNHLESAAFELDQNAAIISYEEYYPFGSTSYRAGRLNTEVKEKRYRYVGKEKDDETGLYYYGARYYAAWLCRFVSVDPLKDKYPQLASYQYAGNDPVGDVDIDGLQSTKEIPRPVKKLEQAKAGDIVDLGNGDRALMLDEVIIKAAPLEIPINLEIKEANPTSLAKGIAVKEGLKKAGNVGGDVAKGIEEDRVAQGFATSQQSRTSKFPTEQRQIKTYRPDGTEDIVTVTQAKNSGNLFDGDSNKGIARKGSTKLTKGLKGLKEATGLAGDFLDLASALKGLAEGDISAVLAAAPGLGLIFEDINNRSDALLSEFLQIDFANTLFTGTISEIENFLYKNQDLGLELVYLTLSQINTITNGEKLDKFDIDAFTPGRDKVPTIIDSQSDFIKIRATIHQ